jgi:hypothetical protein
MGSMRMPHYILTTQTEPWGFNKSSVQNNVEHMELSLCLRFYLRRSLRGYTVGATMGFTIEIIEALALQPCRRILQKCLQ